jgi:hypothetical protein
MEILLPAQTKIGVSYDAAGGSGSLNIWYNPLQAVSAAKGIVEASFIDIVSGICIHRRPGTREYSLNAPVPSSTKLPAQIVATYNVRQV